VRARARARARARMFKMITAFCDASIYSALERITYKELHIKHIKFH